MTEWATTSSLNCIRRLVESGVRVGPSGTESDSQLKGTSRRSIRPLSRAGFVAIIASCMGMSALSIDLALPAFGEMRAEFNLSADSTAVSQIITTFFIGLALGQLVFGPLSDRFGRKPVLFLGIAVYIVGAVGAAFASSLPLLLACRFVWGFGASGPRALALAMVRDRQHGEEMARTMSLAMATFLIVPVLAPALGAALIAVAPWRIVFWFPVGIAFITAAVVARRLPETLPPDRRRSISPGSLAQAFIEVCRHRQTVALGVAAMFLLGGMTSYVGGCEIIMDQVFGQADLFVVMFGLVGVMLAIGALVSARVVVGAGLGRLLRSGAAYTSVIAVAFAAMTYATNGRPPLWSFATAVALLMPGVSMLIPNCNTAAMIPLPHVAGMGAAVLGALSTAGGALLGALGDASFDGTVGPFAWHVLLYVGIATAIIVVFSPGAILARAPTVHR